MKKGKETVFVVFMAIPFVVLFFVVIGIFSFIFLYPHATLETKKIAFLVFVIAIALTFLIFIYSVLIFWAKIEINEKGVKKSLFGKIIKFYEWKEVQEIKIFPTNAGVLNVLYISKESLQGLTLNQCQRKRTNIRLMVNSNKLIEVVKKYAPKDKLKNVLEFEARQSKLK